MTWTEYAAVFGAFLLTHSIPVRPAVRSRLVKLLGHRAFTITYSALSLGMLVLLIRAAGQAPYVELWPQMTWHRHAVHIGMLLVCVILALAIARPNPFSFGGAQNDRFDPGSPGIVAWDRHPILLALAIWSGVHLLPNGDLSHVILFGLLGAFALLGRKLIDRRVQRQIGHQEWIDLQREIARAPKLSLPGNPVPVMVRAFAALALFGALLWLHPYLTGVSAL